LQLHKRSIHSNRRPYECPYCGKMFKTNTILHVHIRVHTGAKRHSCRHCSDRFMWSHQLKRHLLQSHNEGTWLICNICQKKFSNNCVFKDHQQRHEGVKSYFCSECPKRFCTASDLKRHRLVHSNIKRFACGLCCKAFKHKRGVLSHFKRCASNQGFTGL